METGEGDERKHGRLCCQVRVGNGASLSTWCAEQLKLLQSASTALLALVSASLDLDGARSGLIMRNLRGRLAFLVPWPRRTRARTHCSTRWRVALHSPTSPTPCPPRPRSTSPPSRRRFPRTPTRHQPPRRSLRARRCAAPTRPSCAPASTSSVRACLAWSGASGSPRTPPRSTDPTPVIANHDRSCEWVDECRALRGLHKAVQEFAPAPAGAGAGGAEPAGEGGAADAFAQLAGACAFLSFFAKSC